jgi:hypothetical protein
MKSSVPFIGKHNVSLAHVAFVLAIMVIGLAPVPAHAKGGKSCGVYSVTIGNQVFTGKQTILVPAGNVNGKIAHVKGNFTDFFVDMDTFTVLNYKLNGTLVYPSKAPTRKNALTSPLLLKLNNEQLVLDRSGDGNDDDIKVQAKDCNTGGTFQLETDFASREKNVLASAIHYCLLDSVSGRLFFTNGPLLGYDSPELSHVITWGSNQATWAVGAGGRIGMVTGEDAQQALALTGRQSSCGR